jgi:hypothetical protein
MEGTPRPDQVLGLLAEEERLKVLAAIVLGARTAAEVGSATGLPARRAGRALSGLARLGLVESEPDAGYRVRLEVLRAAAGQARAGAAGGGDPAGGDAAAAGEDAAAAGDPGAAAILRRFMRGGRLTAIPASRSKRLVLLDRLAGLFEPGRVYPEAAVNQALAAWHPDYASLRRHLVDEGFLERRAGRYWRAGGTVEVDTE